MEFKDYYETMGLKRDASQDEIKRSYRKLARKFHPDVSKEADAEVRFKSVGEAYEVLKDPEKRKAYDQLGENWKSGQEFKPPPNWDPGFEFQGGGFTQGDASQFSDFFEGLFGGGGGGSFSQSGQRSSRRGFNSKGEDTRTKVQIDLEDTYHGATRSLTLQHSETGADGRAKMKKRTLNVNIPKGVHQGQHIRLARQGGAGMGQGAPGDLYLEVEFKPHPIYHVDGRDVYLDLPLTPWEAALGATVKVPTPTGAVDLKIPSNSKAGSKLRLKGRGIPGKSAGDMYVVMQISLPPSQSDDDKKAYQQMADAFDFNPRQQLGV